MTQTILLTAVHWSSIIALGIGCVLLLKLAHWLMLHAHEIASYRHPLLTVTEDWFVRLFWMVLFSGYTTMVIYAPDQPTRIVLIITLISLSLLVISYWGIYYWYHDRGVGKWYEAHKKQTPVRTELTAFVVFSCVVITVTFLPWLLAPLFVGASHGAWHYHICRKVERDKKLLAKALAFFLTIILWNEYNISSCVHEHVKVSPCTFRFQLELADDATLTRIEQWLLDDVCKEMWAKRIASRVVTDKSNYENPENRTIVDVWMQYET